MRSGWRINLKGPYKKLKLLWKATPIRGTQFCIKLILFLYKLVLVRVPVYSSTGSYKCIKVRLNICVRNAKNSRYVIMTEEGSVS